ncbi:hypothetical protein C0966_15085 [Bacillus methanolicus]|uniref:hypothetical protein n=1 Tax=Bacillus methanolicus TaxID=1471 RepID=UPI0023803CF6|nr:hypothetical protein [Bacillus methanolicus]MDE3840640.1 hypothetical protein [Bacillus methanolicus]
MIGILVNEKEVKELQYLMKREMDEILFYLKDERIEHIVKSAMQERYKVLFSLFKRIASPSDCLKYIPKKSQRNDSFTSMKKNL